MSSRPLYEIVDCTCGKKHGIKALSTSRSASVESVPGGIERTHTEADRGADTRPSTPLEPVARREAGRVDRRVPGSPPVPRERSETLAGTARHDRGTGSSRSASRTGHRHPGVAGQRGALTRSTTSPSG